MTFIEYWNNLKKCHLYGIDYIDIDCGKYIAIIPADFHMISKVDFFSHCYTKRQTPYMMFSNAFYFNPLRNDKSIKVIMVEKGVDIECINNPNCEFTFWLNQRKKDNKLYGLHNHNNKELSKYMLFKGDTPADVWKKEKGYNSFYKISKPYFDKIREAFNEHKKELLHNIFSDIYHALFVEGEGTGVLSMTAQLTYMDGFEEYCKKHKI